jgi:hypothetical protein
VLGVNLRGGTMNKRIVLAAGSAAVIFAIGGGGIAIASGGDDGEGGEIPPATKATAEKAALDATGGGKINQTELDNEDGATYEVEVTKLNGDTVDVRLDEDFRVVTIESDDADHGDD